jgi:hypothetical protein
MSLAIDVDKITGVLMADGWHEVSKRRDGKSSFAMDAYEYLAYHHQDGDVYRDPEIYLGGGNEKLIPATGAYWEESGVEFFCPLTSILAVRYGSPTQRRSKTNHRSRYQGSPEPRRTSNE